MPLLLFLMSGGHAAPSGGAEDGEYTVWEKLYDARLDAALGLQSGAPGQGLQQVLSFVPDELSPYKADTHYWLALALLQAGEVEAAAQELDRIGPREVLSDRDRALLSHVDIAERQIDRLPLREDFTDASSPAPWIRSPIRPGMRDLTLTELDGDRVLVWNTVVQKESDDAIMLAFAERGPGQIHMRLRADRLPANLRGRLEDDEGQQWTARIPTLPPQTWVQVDLSLADFALVGDPFGRHPDPRRLRSFLLMDVTGYRGVESGENSIYVDDLELLP